MVPDCALRASSTLRDGDWLSQGWRVTGSRTGIDRSGVALAAQRLHSKSAARVIQEE